MVSISLFLQLTQAIYAAPVPCLPHLYSTAQSQGLLPLDTPDLVTPVASVTHRKDGCCEHPLTSKCTPAQLSLSPTPCVPHRFYEFLSYR